MEQGLCHALLEPASVRNSVMRVESLSDCARWTRQKGGNALPFAGNAAPHSRPVSGPPSHRLRLRKLKRHEIDARAGTQLAFLPAMRVTTLFIYITLLILASAGLRATAATTELSAISSAAENAVRARAGAAADQLILEAAPLDQRLRVSGCDRPLTGFLTDTSSLRYQNTVGVRCDGSVRWTVYTTVHVESQAVVLVTRRALGRDAETTAADFKLETRRLPGLPSAYVSDAAALKGQRLSRPLPVDQPLSFEALAPANLIHRGQAVVLVAHSGGFEVRVNGVALSDGRASEHIRVQNASSQRVVEGIVRSDSEVEAPL